MLEEIDENAEGNPYAYFPCCCIKFHIKQYSQMTGVMSFSVFVCMVVILLYSIGIFSIFYISIGVIVYSFLMRAIFHEPIEKLSVLAYLIFESVQIGLLCALIVYLVMPVFFGSLIECVEGSSSYYRGCNSREVSRRANNERVARFQLLICLTLLTIMKFYFTRVFARFYKYLLWVERKNSHLQAQYWNARGVRINVDDVFATTGVGGTSFNAPPHVVWANNGSSYVLNLGTLPTLPSYNQLVDVAGGKPLTETCSSVDRSFCNLLAPPTWDGEVSPAPTTPPTYILPTSQKPVLQPHSSSVLQQEIPVTSQDNETQLPKRAKNMKHKSTDESDATETSLTNKNSDEKVTTPHNNEASNAMEVIRIFSDNDVMDEEKAAHSQ